MTERRLYAMVVFGTRLYFGMFSLKGNVQETDCMQITNEIISTIGMTVAPGESMSRYPVEGKGGFGYTFFQPLTESFIAFDAWPDLNGAYLAICSCKNFSKKDVVATLQSLGLEVVETKKGRLGIENKTNY
jgi:hypothetical protein